VNGQLDGSQREAVNGYASASIAHSPLLRMLPGKGRYLGEFCSGGGLFVLRPAEVLGGLLGGSGGGIRWLSRCLLYHIITSSFIVTLTSATPDNNSRPNTKLKIYLHKNTLSHKIQQYERQKA